MIDRENLSHEQQALLEKLDNREGMVRLAAYGLMGLNLIGIGLCVACFLIFSQLLSERTGAPLKAEMLADFEEFEALEKQSRETMTQSRQLGKDVDFDISARQIQALASELIQYERENQRFFRVLKVNMYNLSRQIPGTDSWFELYSPAIDAAIERSRSRELTLLQVNQFYAEREPVA
jgi:hypothetical protein